MLIIAKPAVNVVSGSGGAGIGLQVSGSTVSGSPFSTINLTNEFVASGAGTTATISLSGSQDGAILMSVDGRVRPVIPLVSLESGWLINDDGVLLIVE